MNFPDLNLPKAELKIKEEAGKKKVFDIIRKKWYILTPEEWVRQHWIHALINHAQYPIGLFEIESAIDFNGMKKRFDIVVRNKDLSIFLLIECKAPEVSISNDTFLQASKYAKILKPNYIFLSNGLQHQQFKNTGKEIEQMQGIPAYTH